VASGRARHCVRAASLLSRLRRHDYGVSHVQTSYPQLAYLQSLDLRPTDDEPANRYETDRDRAERNSADCNCADRLRADGQCANRNGPDGSSYFLNLI